MALITTLTTDNGIARVKQDGVDHTWRAYLFDTEEAADKNNYYKLGQGFNTPVEALDWANSILKSK